MVSTQHKIGRKRPTDPQCKRKSGPRSGGKRGNSEEGMDSGGGQSLRKRNQGTKYPKGREN